MIFLVNILGLFFWNIKNALLLLILFQKILDESGHKPNKIWLSKGCEFYNGSIKSWLEEKGIERYSTHNERKSVVAENLLKP